jgi:hypothetical protein
MHQSSVFDSASQICRETWPKSIYSSFHFLELLVRISDQDWPEFVRNRRVSKSLHTTISHKIETKYDQELDLLWKNNHGMCTSWSILIGSKLENLGFQDFKFCLADSGRHRLGYTADGILIDSSVREALQLKDSVPKFAGNFIYFFNCVKGKSPTLKYTVG